MKRKIKNLFTDDRGIFYYLSGFNPPWDNGGDPEETIDYSVLDAEYLYNIAGDRFVSPLTEYYWGDDEHITVLHAQQLAHIIASINNERWTRLWNSLKLEYNPIENYDMHEVMTDDETVIEYGHTNTRTPNTTDTDVSEIQGFNSSAYKPSDRYTETHTGTDTNVESGDDTHTRNYDLRRTGNIGVTTSQQMIESERKLWIWDFFHDVVFQDINRYLTLSIY